MKRNEYSLRSFLPEELLSAQLKQILSSASDFFSWSSKVHICTGGQPIIALSKIDRPLIDQDQDGIPPKLFTVSIVLLHSG